MSLYFSSLAACLHILFVGITLVGGVLFLAWALKLKADELKKWVVRLLVLGVLGSLITSSFGMIGFRMMHGKGLGYERGMMNVEKTIKTQGPGDMMRIK